MNLIFNVSEAMLQKNGERMSAPTKDLNAWVLEK